MSKLSLAIIGVGRLGSALVKLLDRVGYAVTVAGRNADELELMVSIYAPNAAVATPSQAIAACDTVILAIPLHQYRTLNPELLAGKIVIDAMNYWPPVEGEIAEFNGERGSSEVIAEYLAGSRIVKALNHIGYGELETDVNTGRAMLCSGDDAKAKETVAQLIRDIGYVPVDLGALYEGWRHQPDTPLFDARYTANNLPMEK